MRIKTVIIHNDKRYESALGSEITELNYEEVKQYMAKQMPLTALNIEDIYGNQLYFGRKIIEESIVMIEIVNADQEA